jgi:DNA repair exonuclease SbcCD ATPase subunit
MFKKIIFPILILSTFSYASFEKIKIGKIDSYYKDKINYQEIRNILDQIEHTFESELNMNVFDYSKDGKVIDILYVPPSKLERRIDKKIQKLKLKKAKIENIQNSLPEKLKNINKEKEFVKEERLILNKRIETLNDYVKEVNKQKNFSKQDYVKVKAYIKEQQIKIKSYTNTFKRNQRKVQSKVNSYNQKVNLQNSLIRDFKRLNTELERMNRSFKKVKGNAIGLKQVTSKVFYKDGKRVKEKTVKNIMNKIEIYGFDSKEELKVILAHEIAHLVGIPHINEKDALMNPILQQNQINQLSLTQSDIINFKKNF